MAHINYKLDLCSEVFIVNNNKVLLRKHDKLGIWLSVGGHIEPNEDPAEAAVREVKEEVGLNVKLYQTDENLRVLNSDSRRMLPTPQFMERHSITKTHEHVAMIFFATSKTDNLILSDIEVTEDCKWFTKEEIENHEEIIDSIKIYALKALETLSN